MTMIRKTVVHKPGCLCGAAIDGAGVELSKPVDRLVGGEAYRLRGWELKDGGETHFASLRKPDRPATQAG
jgi:hypothetical protein